MNILVIATHHGAFLTLMQLQKWNVKNVTVVIPQSQIDKYKTFDGTIFTKYRQNIKKFAGRKMKVYISEDWDAGNKLRSAHSFIHTIGGAGEWAVLEAGSLLGSRRVFPKFDTTFGVVKARVHPKLKKLYTMLGEPEFSDIICAGAFFINMDSQDRRVTFLDSGVVHRPDVLYAKSFGPLACVRYQNRVKDCFAMCFWMDVIRKKQESGEWLAYPYHDYLAHAQWAAEYLPRATYHNIETNGLNTEWAEDLFALDL